MGVDAGDINNDGFADLYITNLYENVLFLNNGNGTFANVTQPARVGDRGMGWGVTWLDYDNDGWQDIYVCNETYFKVDGIEYPNVLYRNQGDGTFLPVSANSPVSSPFGGYGTACSDLNGDGRADLLIVNSGKDGNQILFNMENTPNHWVMIRLQGTDANRSAVGARVRIEAGGRKLSDQVIAGSGFASQNSLALHFGLGTLTRIDRLTVFWPGGDTETFEGLAADRLYRIVQGAGPATGYRQPEAGPGRMELAPNPTAGTVRITLELSEKTPSLTLRLFDTGGRLAGEKPLGALGPGVHQVEWALPAEMSNGMYRVDAGGVRCSLSVVR